MINRRKVADSSIDFTKTENNPADNLNELAFNKLYISQNSRTDDSHDINVPDTSPHQSVGILQEKEKPPDKEVNQSDNDEIDMDETSDDDINEDLVLETPPADAH
ncbi:Zn-dependent protease [Sesbania bispinosa]|nr:Zn-dependent protease [Sesbania bispinosa]